MSAACLVCTAPSSSTCGRCKVAKYCSRECQKKHWPEHKLTCQQEPGGAAAQSPSPSPSPASSELDKLDGCDPTFARMVRRVLERQMRPRKSRGQVDEAVAAESAAPPPGSGIPLNEAKIDRHSLRHDADADSDEWGAKKPGYVDPTGMPEESNEMGVPTGHPTLSMFYNYSSECSTVDMSEAYSFLDATWERAVMLTYTTHPHAPDCLQVARAALKIHRDVPNAYMLLASQMPYGPERVQMLHDAVASGRRLLAEFVKSEKASGVHQIPYWEALPTRPLMRAMVGLGITLMATGDTAAALLILRELLRMHRSDHMMVRMFLPALMLIEGHDKDCGALLNSYASMDSPNRYTRALWFFRNQRHSPAIGEVIKSALNANVDIADLLLRREYPLLCKQPDMTVYGYPDEAEEYLRLGGMLAWDLTPGALKWLAAERRKFTGSSRAQGWGMKK